MRRLLAVAAVAILGLTAGCSGAISDAGLKPVVKPPAIARAGVLRAAVDLTYPPFGGTVKGERVGLDLDIAAALAARLGLKLEIVAGAPEAATALVKSRKADVAFGALTVEQAVANDVSFAGTYVSDAPAVFSSKAATLTVGDLGGKRIAVQKESYAHWVLLDEYGPDNIVVMASLRDAMSAAASGTVDLAAGDALVGAYLLRDLPSLHFNGQLSSAYPLGVLVSKENPTLEAKVRAALDDMAAKGVLSTLRRKWAGDIPLLVSPGADGSTEPTATQ